MGEQVIRIVVERQGGAILPQTRSDVIGLTEAQTALTVSTRSQQGALAGLGTVTGALGGHMEGAMLRTRMLRGALAQLAFQFTGTAGPAGRLAEGLLIFGGGHTLTLGAVAGIAAIGLALHNMGREAHEAEQRTASLAERIEKFRLTQDPSRTLRTEQRDVSREIAQARDRIRAAEQVLRTTPDLHGGSDAELALQSRRLLASGNIEAANREIASATTRLAQIPAAIAALAHEGPREPASILNFRDKFRDTVLDDSVFRILGSRPAVRNIGMGLRSPTGNVGMLPDVTTNVRDDLRGFLEETEHVGKGVRKMTTDMKHAAAGADLLGVHLIGAVAGAIGSLASGGSAGSFLGGVGGILGMLPGGQLPGALLAGAGTVVSGFESRGVRIDSYGATALRQMQNVRGGPDTITLVVTSPTTGETLRTLNYRLRREERLDRTERLPAGMSLS